MAPCLVVPAAAAPGSLVRERKRGKTDRARERERKERGREKEDRERKKKREEGRGGGEQRAAVGSETTKGRSAKGFRAYGLGFGV
jgi:hypothetical protein